MNCHVCGCALKPVQTDLPFKLGETRIVVVKALPVLQCENCVEYLIEDPVMERLDHLLSLGDASVELQVVPYAA